MDGGRVVQVCNGGRCRKGLDVSWRGKRAPLVWEPIGLPSLILNEHQLLDLHIMRSREMILYVVE